MGVKQTKLYVPKGGSNIEHTVVRTLLQELKAVGWSPYFVHDLETGSRILLKNFTRTLDHVFAFDGHHTTVYFRKGKQIFWIRFHGGQGSAIIANWQLPQLELKYPEFAQTIEKVIKTVQTGVWVLIV